MHRKNSQLTKKRILAKSAFHVSGAVMNDVLPAGKQILVKVNVRLPEDKKKENILI
ncbi:MAG: hypothetical protein JRI91_02340 [Deltaproteobacteria bacterium]|nr:hypothetical protein [Deltaproteobacteria bacterium]